MHKVDEPVYIGEISSTPLGPVWVAVSERGLVGVEVGPNEEALFKLLTHLGFQQVLVDESKTAAAAHQISQYLQGERKSFNLPIDWSILTPFQERALKATYAIPYGKVMTYGEIAQQLGNPHAARAVGRAQATNPMPLVIPCHRVIGADGNLHGYGAGEGLATKAWLLKLEKEN
jgi:methylated-DNA-[protein]-cysteine S-methyltransferase